MPDPARVLRRRRSPLVLVLGGVLVALVLVVEVLIFQAYANVNRTTAIFGERSFLNSTLVNAQREALLLEDEIEDLPTTGDLKGVRSGAACSSTSSARPRGRSATRRSPRPLSRPAGTWR